MENKPENRDENFRPQQKGSTAPPVTVAPQPRSNRGLIIALIILVLAIAAAGIYFYQQTQNLAEEAAQKEQQLQQAYYDLDSIGSELDDKILRIRELGGNVDSLVAVKAELEGEKARLRRREISQSKQIKALRDRVGGYKELLLAKDEEIKELTAINQELAKENNQLKVDKNELSQTVNDLNQQKSQLEEKVATASQLKIEDFVVFAVNKKGKEFKNPFRRKQLEQLKIQFTLAENKVAPIEGKEIILKVIGIDGNPLFDVANGSGSFTYEGREQFYTAKQDVLYDRTKKQVTFLYTKGSEYDKGTYKVELYTDNYILGKGNFTVR